METGTVVAAIRAAAGRLTAAAATIRMAPAAAGIKRLAALAIVGCGCLSLQAQDMPFRAGESLTYTAEYKWGLITLKAGTAHYKLSKATYEGTPAIRTTLTLKSSSMVDKLLIVIRDTMRSYATADDLTPLFQDRQVHEGDDVYTEEYDFHTFGNNYTEASMLRLRDGKVNRDTLLKANNRAYDILNVFLYARTLDLTNMPLDTKIKLSVFLGRNPVHFVAQYKGQAVYEKSETLKYKTHYLVIDSADESFTEKKSAIEVWLSDDDNQIPLRIKAKLKFGAVDINLSGHNHLTHPFTSEVRLRQ